MTGKKTIILGIGNPLLTDDAVGLHMVRSLQARFGNEESFDFKENHSGGLELLDDLRGYKKAALIDCLQTPGYPAGTCLELTLNDLADTGLESFVTTHGLTLTTLIAFGRKLGFSLPEEYKIFGIVGYDCENFSEELSERLQETYEKNLAAVKKAIGTWKQ